MFLFLIHEYVKQIVPPVINSFSDQDSRVRYYACEALYNIAKVKKDVVVIHVVWFILLFVVGIDAPLPFSSGLLYRL